MNRYPIRVAKYILYIAVIFGVVMGIFAFAYKEPMTFDHFQTAQGKIMLGLLGVLIFIFPILNYTNKTLVFDVTKRAAEVDKIMEICGYSKVGDENSQKTYRAKSFTKKLNLMFEDTITIVTDNEVSIMNGPRKEITRAYLRLNDLARQENN